MKQNWAKTIETYTDQIHEMMDDFLKKNVARSW